MSLLSKLTNILSTTILNYRPNDKHIWVSPIKDSRLEHEVHYMHLVDPDRIDLCEAFNLIPDNKHEGFGWWEKVIVTRDRGFTADEKVRIFRSIDLDVRASGICTYIPQEVLADIRKTPGKVIGFRPHEAPQGVLSTVVWIHYV